MGEFFAKLLDFFTNISLKKVFGLAIIVSIIAIGFPYVDNIFFKPSRIEKQIKLLNDLSLVDVDKLKTQDLIGIYDAIKSDLSHSLGIQEPWENVVRYSFWTMETLYKFLSSASIWILVLILSTFLRFEKSRRGPMILAMLLIIVVSGSAGAVIPTFRYPAINYAGMPLIQIVSLGAIAVVQQARERRNKDNPKTGT